MYYEEKMINGLLKYRIHPDGSWHNCTIYKAGAKIVQLEKRIAELEDENSGLNAAAESMQADVYSMIDELDYYEEKP